jgi:hypothetical protein
LPVSAKLAPDIGVESTTAFLDELGRALREAEGGSTPEGTTPETSTAGK